MNTLDIINDYANAILHHNYDTALDQGDNWYMCWHGQVTVYYKVINGTVIEVMVD